MRILETDTMAIIDAIEVLDSSNDGLGGVVRIDKDSERNARSCLGTLIKEKLEGYGLSRLFLCHPGGLW